MLKHERNKRGFTLVEVSLFLAVTGLLFMGIAVGVQNSIYQQRFNDSVQNFAEFLRTVYSGTINVENNLGKGNSAQAIYGKLVTFNQDDGKNQIDIYNVVGDIAATNEGDNTLERLSSLKVGLQEESGIVENYTPRWMAQIKNTENNLYKGSILVVRNPSSGIVYTYSSEESNPENIFKDNFASKFTSNKNVDFCVSPEGVNDLNSSRNVRIADGTRNASGIEIISDEESACRS